MNPNTTPCPPHLVGKLHESPLPDGVPQPPNGFAHVMGPFNPDSDGPVESIIMLRGLEWNATGWNGNAKGSYAVPRHWLASELQKPAIHVEVRLPDVQLKWDEVETFLLDKDGCWLAGMTHMEWFSKSGYENYLDVQEGRLAVGRTKEEAIANYLKRREGK